MITVTRLNGGMVKAVMSFSPQSIDEVREQLTNEGLSAPIVDTFIRKYMEIKPKMDFYMELNGTQSEVMLSCFDMVTD